MYTEVKHEYGTKLRYRYVPSIYNNLAHNLLPRFGPCFYFYYDSRQF